jgi:hypothetical protein
VLETGKTVSSRAQSSSKEPYSLPLPGDRGAQLNRRLSEGSPIFSGYRNPVPPSRPSSNDQSPCEIKVNLSFDFSFENLN